MPDHRPRVKTDLPSMLEQAPANIDIISGCPEPRVKPPNRSKFLCSKRAIAPGDVLGVAMGNHHMSRTARRICDARSNRTVLRRRNIGSSYGSVIRGHVCPGEVMKPVRIGPRIVVQIRDDLPCCRTHSSVSCGTEPLIALTNQPHGILMRNLGTVVGGSVIHNDNLVIRVLQPRQTFETVPQRT